jgi:hypothetical protein
VFLAIFVPSLIVSLVFGGLGLWVDLESIQDDLRREAFVLSDLLERAVSGPMSINDEQTLASTLEAALAQDNVISITATDANGLIVGKYSRRKNHIAAHRTYSVTSDITVGKEVIGELSVLVSLEPYFSRRFWYIIGALCSLVVLTSPAFARP